MSTGEENGLNVAVGQYCAFHLTQRLWLLLIPRRCRAALACLLVQLCLFACGNALAQVEEITWIVLDWPPVNILQGGAAPAAPDQLGAGIVDRELAEIVARMPQVQHKFVLSNIQRVWSQFAAGQSSGFIGQQLNAA